MQVLRAGMDIKKAALEHCIDVDGARGDAGKLICGQDDKFYICGDGKDSVSARPCVRKCARFQNHTACRSETLKCVWFAGGDPNIRLSGWIFTGAEDIQSRLDD